MLHFFGTIFVGIFATQTAWKISLFGWFFGLFNVIPVAIEVRNTRAHSPLMGAYVTIHTLPCTTVKFSPTQQRAAKTCTLEIRRGGGVVMNRAG